MGTRNVASALSANGYKPRTIQGRLRVAEALVASKAPGDAPDAPAVELPRSRVLRFEVAADTFATFREAVRHLQRSACASLDDDALLLAMARHDERTATPQRSGHAHVDAPRPHVRPRPRAKQSIPPALRRAVLARDKRRCSVPRCTHATFMDLHHVQPRAEGGLNEASNLLTLCGAHHRAAHRGELLIERDHDGAVVFRHADGSAYGHPTAPRFIDAHAKVFSALRHLGFREGEVKTVLSELRRDAGLDGATVERLLREALCRIRSKAQ